MSTVTHLSTSEVARRFAVSRGTVANWVNAGKLKPAMRGPGPNGGAFMFEPSEVERFAGTLRTVYRAS
jgi:excisionase family DNA binding protein